MHISAAEELTHFICSPLSQGTSTSIPSCIIHQENRNNLPVVKQLGIQCKSRGSAWERGSFTTCSKLLMLLHTASLGTRVGPTQTITTQARGCGCLGQITLKMGLFLSWWQKHWPLPMPWKGTCFIYIQVDSHTLSILGGFLAHKWENLTFSFVMIKSLCLL